MVRIESLVKFVLFNHWPRFSAFAFTNALKHDLEYLIQGVGVMEN